MQKVFLYILLLLSVFFFWTSAQAAPTDSPNDISKTSFQINVNEFTPGDNKLAGTSGGSKEVVNNVLANLINKMIVAMGVIALFIMTIGAGYMIIYHGQDEFLSRWKSIFVAGLISLAVALSAGMIVNLMSYFLYK